MIQIQKNLESDALSNLETVDKDEENINSTNNENEHNNQENTADETQDSNLESISQLTKSIERLSLDTNINDHITLTHNSDKLPKPSQYVEFQLENKNEWNKCQIISTAGKATSKQKHLFNTLNLSDETIQLNDWSKINKLRLINERCENIFLATQCSEQEILAAKIDEIEKWKENHVFEPIYYDGQKKITTRWVLTERFANGKKKIKARLVAQGFKEDSSEILKDSPTCTTESLRFILTIMASNRWTCNSIDIDQPFYQEKKQIESYI